MTKPVLFASTRPLERAENLHALYNAYDGEKEFVQTNGCRRHPSIRSGKYDLMVIDEFPSETPGKCVMIWHAIQGGKTIGLDQPEPYYYRHQAELMNFIVTSGEGAADMFAICSGLPRERVLSLGMPRTDAYIGKCKGDGHTVLAGKRSYLYVPTFRRGRETAMPDVDWNFIDNVLTDGELLVIKAHIATGSIGIGKYSHIVEVPSSETSGEYLIDCDVVITDYSSIMFDGYLLGKPCVLFEKNPGYTRTRGMYMRYPYEYSSRYCKTEESLLSEIRRATELTDTERKCIRKVADACDGHATERICRLIHSMV